MTGRRCRVLAFLNIWLQDSRWRMPIVLVLAAAITYLLCYPLLKLSHRLRLLDVPVNRSSHSTPIPRTGGVAIVVGGMISVLLVTEPTWAFLLSAAIGGGIAVISFFDDLYTIPALPRLMVHILVSAMTVWSLRLIPTQLGLPLWDVQMPIWLAAIVATLYVVVIVNFYNFMDGINGQAGTQGVIAGTAFSLLLLFGHSGNSVYAAAALAGACLGFLPHNFPRARMFMGDTGATTLGFGLAMLTLIGGARTNVPWMAFILPLGLFIYGPAFTVIKRICQGANPMKPHKEFHFHLLIRCGWSHDDTTRLQSNIMFVCAASGWFYAWYPSLRLWLLCGMAVMFATYSIWVHWYFARHRLDRTDADPADTARTNTNDTPSPAPADAQPPGSSVAVDEA